MDDTDRLVIGQAVFSRIADEKSTRNEDGLRGRFDAQMREEYERTGYRNRDLTLDGEKVGSAWVNVTRPKPPTTTARVVVGDPGQVVAWARDNPDDVAAFVRENAAEFAEWQLAETGCVVDGAQVVEEAHEAEPARVRSVTLKVDPEAVARALRGRLPEAIAGLLEGGDDLSQSQS